MNIVSWREMPKEAKSLLLKIFGFEEDSEGFVINNGERIIDKYIKEPVKYDNVCLFPTNTNIPIIIDNNPISIASYLEEYEEKKN